MEEAAAGGKAVSPADLRAAEARAAGGEAMTWVLAPEVAQAFAQAQAQAQAVQANAAALVTAKANKPAATPEEALAAAAAAEALGVAPGGAEETTGPPLPAGWVKVPHEGDFYFW